MGPGLKLVNRGRSSGYFLNVHKYKIAIGWAALSFELFCDGRLLES